MSFAHPFRAASIPVLCLGLAFALVLALAAPARAVGLLRDADIEHALGELAAPLLRGAGLSPRRVKVMVVDAASLNAFVIDNRTIYLHYGLVSKTGSAAMLQAVIAHEAAHISNGHLSRRMNNMAGARTAAGLGMALAAVAAAAGGGEAAAGLAIGTASSAQAAFFKHTRAEESAADRSASSYLRSAGINPQGMVDMHRLFRGQELLSESRQDPYLRSHPLTTDRIRAAEAYVAAHGNDAAPDAQAEYWFARARAKLSAFTRPPDWTLRRAGEETHDDIRLMREAIAWHRLSDVNRALASIDAAIAMRPEDAWYHDLRGQILIENRRFDAAVDAYARAVELAPGDALILAGHGRALLAAGHPRDALEQLERARERDFRDLRALHDMALAYAQLGENGMASLVTAERYALSGRMDDAGLNAKRAYALLPHGSAPWQRAQDVLIASERNAKRKKR